MSVDTLDSNLELTRDYDGIKFLGKVVKNEDPLNLDRVQVRVDGLYDPDDGEVPWAGPRKLSSFGIGNGFGIYGVPAVGADVIITLQNGDPHYPMYESVQRYAHLDYPSGHVWGFVDPDGNKLKVDLQGHTVTFTSSTNVVFHIDNQGNLSVDVPGTTTVTSQKTISLISEQDMNLNATGSINIDAGTAVNIDAGTDVNVTAPNINNTGDVDTQGDQTSNGSIVNNGKHVDSTHTHDGIKRGGEISNPPNN